MNSAGAKNNIFQTFDVLESAQIWEANDPAFCPGSVTFLVDLESWLHLAHGFTIHPLAGVNVK